MRSSLPPRVHTLAMGLAGALAVIAVWWLAGATVGGHYRIPTPVEVVRSVGDNGLGWYRQIFWPTLREALIGFAYGVAVALVLAAVVFVVPVLESVVMQIAVVTYCIPLVAVAPVLIAINPTPVEGSPLRTAVELAALSVVFTTVVGAVVGFKSADAASLDVVRVYGGGRLQQLVRVRLVAAVPALVSALQIAAPAAWLGALLGEFFDLRLTNCVANALYQSQQRGDIGTAWSIGIGCALVSGVGYALFGLLGRVVTPWAKGVAA